MGIVSPSVTTPRKFWRAVHEAEVRITRADKYAELGFPASQVQAPRRSIRPAHRPPARCASSAKGAVGTTSRWNRRSRIPVRAGASFHIRTGIIMGVPAARHAPSWKRRYHPHQRDRSGSDRSRCRRRCRRPPRRRCHLVQDQGRELFDFRRPAPRRNHCIGKRLERTSRSASRILFSPALPGTRLVAVGAVRRDGRDVVEIQTITPATAFATLRHQPRRLRHRRRRRRGWC